MCKLCDSKPVYEFTNQKKLCKRCFINWFEKKFFYINRKFSLLNTGENVKRITDKSFRGAVLEHMLKIKGVKLGSTGKIALTDTTDSVADEFVHSVISGDMTKVKVSAVEGKTVRPLYLFLDKEVKLYADLKGLKYKTKKEKKDKISLFLDELELKHPEVKQAVLRSYIELN